MHTFVLSVFCFQTNLFSNRIYLKIIFCLINHTITDIRTTTGAILLLNPTLDCHGRTFAMATKITSTEGRLIITRALACTSAQWMDATLLPTPLSQRLSRDDLFARAWFLRSHSTSQHASTIKFSWFIQAHALLTGHGSFILQQQTMKRVAQLSTTLGSTITTSPQTRKLRNVQQPNSSKSYDQTQGRLQQY